MSDLREVIKAKLKATWGKDGDGEDIDGSPPRPYFADDYDGAISEASTRDVVYIHETDSIRSPRGLGYNCREREELMQLHLYGPGGLKRGKGVRDELERILDLRGTRVRPDDECILFMDRRTYRPTDRGIYTYVYELRGRFMEGY